MSLQSGAQVGILGLKERRSVKPSDLKNQASVSCRTAVGKRALCPPEFFSLLHHRSIKHRLLARVAIDLWGNLHGAGASMLSPLPHCGAGAFFYFRK